MTLGIAAALMVSTMPTGMAAAAPAPRGCETRDNDTAEKLLECVTLDGVERHLKKFAAIAKANKDSEFPGSRASGTQGYEDSVRYVAGELRGAGYDVTLDEFEISYNPAELRQLTPIQADYPTAAFLGSGVGQVTGAVVPVKLDLDNPEESTSGCVAADFDGLDFSGTNDIALIQRGGCDFGEKVDNAQAAGAEAVVIFNQGTPDALDLVSGAVGDEDGQPVDVPVVGAAYADGVALSAPGATAEVTVLPAVVRTDVNVIADLPGANRENIVLAGAHLDSAETSPGINDNGSGAAALLETALQMANHKPQNSVRFAWWGAEEVGFLGSFNYVVGLSPDELGRIALYLNYDMVASPNYVFMVRDGDGSTIPLPEVLPTLPGAAAIEDVYARYYTEVGEPFTAAPLDLRGDYVPFVLYGVPSGGLFTGAEGIKTREEQKIWGGTAGKPFDPCYHRACDNLGNINRHALNVNSHAIAYAQLTFAYSTEAVNGVPGAEMPDGGKLPKPHDKNHWLKWPGLPTTKWHNRWDHRNWQHRTWHKLHSRHETVQRRVEAALDRLRFADKVMDKRAGEHGHRETLPDPSSVGSR